MSPNNTPAASAGKIAHYLLLHKHQRAHVAIIARVGAFEHVPLRIELCHHLLHALGRLAHRIGARAPFQLHYFGFALGACNDYLSVALKLRHFYYHYIRPARLRQRRRRGQRYQAGPQE